MTFEEVLKKYGNAASNIVLFLIKLNESEEDNIESFEKYLDDWYNHCSCDEGISKYCEDNNADVRGLIVGSVEYYTGGYRKKPNKSLVQKVKKYYLKYEKE